MRSASVNWMCICFKLNQNLLFAFRVALRKKVFHYVSFDYNFTTLGRWQKVSHEGIVPVQSELTNWRQFFMRLSCYWSWISSYHCQSSCGFRSRKPSGSADYFDSVMTKFIVNNRTDAWKTDFNLFFTITDCQIVRSRLFTHRINHRFMSVRLLTMKISQWARENFCSYRKKMTDEGLGA